MYSVVLMVALTSGAHSPAWGYPGCYGGCYGGYSCGGCYGGYNCGGCYGCYGGYNCGGCYGGYNCGGCYGGYNCGGCYGGYNCGGCYGGYDCGGCFATYDYSGCYGGYNCGGCYGGYNCGGCYGSCYSGYGCCGGYADYNCSGCSGCCGCYASSCSGCSGGAVPAAPSYIPPAATNGTMPPASESTQTAEEQQWFNELKAQGEMAPNVIEAWNRSSHEERQKYYQEHIKKGDKGDKGAGAVRLLKQRGAFTVHLPAGAKLMIDDVVATPRLASTRRFLSPPLEAGQQCSYMVKVTVTRGGQDVTTSKRVQLRAGSELEVTFDSAPAQSVASK